MIACLLILVSTHTYADVWDEVPPVPIPAPAQVSVDDLKTAIKDLNFEHALRILQDLAVQKYHELLTNPDSLQKLVDKLKNVLEDDSKSDVEKKDTVLTMINESMGEFKSEPSGSANLALKYSIDYGVSRLEWDNNVVIDKCSGNFVGWECLEWGYDYQGYYGCLNDRYSARYWEDHVLRIPDYHIYKLINGVEEAVTKIQGTRSVQRNQVSVSTDDNWVNIIKQAYDFSEFEPIKAPEGKVVWLDINAGYRNQGDTVAYRVEIDNSSTKYGSCGGNLTKDGTSILDGNGDGRVDFIPASEYPSSVAAWLIPINHLLLN